MSTIIVYRRRESGELILDEDARRRGMKQAGRKLRKALSDDDGSVNDADAEDRVIGVFEDLIFGRSDGLLNFFVSFERAGTPEAVYKIHGNQDKQGRYILTHWDNLNQNSPDKAPKATTDSTYDQSKDGALRLDVGLDDAIIPKKNIFRMRLTVPRAARDADSWAYLTELVNTDVNEIEMEPADDAAEIPIRIQNYLISTFMFSRCR